MKILFSVYSGVKLGLLALRVEQTFLVARTGFVLKREEARGGWRKLTSFMIYACNRI
jgi:hypothetical protein